MDELLQQVDDRDGYESGPSTSASIDEGLERSGRARRDSRWSGQEILGGFRLHPVGVDIQDGVDQRTWYEFGKMLQRVDYAWNWIVADWLAYGDHEYGDQVYKLATRLFGKSPRSWEDYAYIARNIKVSERSEILPVLTHKPVARFHDDRDLQRTLVSVAEQHSLSKAVFEAVIELYLEGKSYRHLLPENVTPVVRAQWRAEKERQRIRKRVLTKGGDEWLLYAREQADGWKRLVAELTRHSRSA